MPTSKIVAAGALAMLLAGAGFSRPASAGYSLTISDQASGVVATGSGSINFTNLTPEGSFTYPWPGILPLVGILATGGTAGGER